MVILLKDDATKDNVLEQLEKLKEVSSPAGKLYNWNIITKAMEKISIFVDRDVKSLIIAGDVDMINEVLK